MERYLKTSVSRKTLHTMSERQKRRIRSEYRTNIRILCASNHTIGTRNDVHTFNSSIAPQESIASNNTFNNLTCSENIDNTKEATDVSSSSMSDVNDICDESDESDVSSYTHCLQEVSFRDQLASCFVDNNITHVQGNRLLFLLRKHPCFSYLPKDVRTLLNTPRRCLDIYTVPPGEYLHFDLEIAIVDSLSDILCTSVNEVVLDFSTDGCNLDKQSIIHIWPIQCRIVNVEKAPLIVVGIYKDPHKPNSPNIFFEKFVEDVRRIMSKGGIDFLGQRVPLRLRCFIADAPARAFILHHRGHMAEHPCSKCKVSGTRIDTNHFVFNGINHPPRTDDEYIRRVDDSHHKDGISPLSLLPMGMVSQVPFESMHLVNIGVMKKLFQAWVQGKFSRETKLSKRIITIINTRIQSLQEYCPSDFARRPRSLELYSKYKATELRQFLLYTGPAILYGLLDDIVYKHFLFLHTAIRILASTSPREQYLCFAERALQKFVLHCPHLYGARFNSYNVHGLLHLTDDVRRFGALDTFSAFPYESNMSIFRKFCRKANQPLQQMFNRMKELQTHGSAESHKDETCVRVFIPYNNGNRIQYRKIAFNNFLFSTNLRDNCCILKDGCICIISDIFKDGNSYRLNVKKFLEVDNFYNVGISSSHLQIYKCAALADDVSHITLNEVCAKGYRMPFWGSMTDESDSDGSTVNTVSDTSRYYIVVAIMHNKVL
ncbi:uncharacterized protein [Temnothorax nylanderi]|uniref:uncharacterized protein n=1 Tax=Temnothorax nylanderi TaxID=102681 RepID=UPI003A8A8D6E